MTEAQRENLKQSIVVHDDYLEGYLKVEIEASKLLVELVAQREAIDTQIRQNRDRVNSALNGRYACTVYIRNVETQLREDRDGRP